MSEILPIEWFFHRSYGEDFSDLLEARLTDPFCDWVKETELVLRRHLSRNLSEDSACIAQESRFVIEGMSGVKVFCLHLLSIRRENPVPIQCTIFVGPHDYIVKKKSELVGKFEEHLIKFGDESTVMEDAGEVAHEILAGCDLNPPDLEGQYEIDSDVKP